MRYLALIFVALAPAFTLANAQQTTQTSLKRELLVFAPSVRGISFKTQMTWLTASKKALRERDMEIVLVLGDTHEADRKPYTVDDLFVLLNSRDEVEQRHNFHIAPKDFSVILIGKDGTEKLRQTSPISTEKLCAVIDAMPGRQDEMRERNIRVP